MPLLKKEDFALGDENSNFGLHCANSDGSLKTCEEIFQGGVEFFLGSLGGSREMAEKITLKICCHCRLGRGKDCGF